MKVAGYASDWLRTSLGTKAPACISLTMPVDNEVILCLFANLTNISNIFKADK